MALQLNEHSNNNAVQKYLIDARTRLPTAVSTGQSEPGRCFRLELADKKGNCDVYATYNN